MKKKLILLMIVCSSILLVSGCNKKVDNSKAIEFKEDYESMNGKTNSKGAEHRTVSIDKDNPYVHVSAKDILKKIDNKETFYVYFGDKLCPWCRSVIEKSIEVAKKNNIDKIYYVNIWDDEGNEILRDRYSYEDGKLNKTVEGTDEYYELLKKFDNLLSDYTLTNENEEKVEVGEKRIYAPNFIYVKNGKAVKLIEGISSLQSDSREELTDEILKDEEKQFNEFFNN